MPHIQTRAQPPLPPLRLTFFINVVGCISLVSCYNLPRALGRLVRERRAIDTSAAAAAAVDTLAHESDPLFPSDQVRFSAQALARFQRPLFHANEISVMRNSTRVDRYSEHRFSNQNCRGSRVV